MQTTVTGHHIEVTPALRAYVTEKMQRISRHFEHIISASFVLTVEKLEHKAEGAITVSGGGRSIFAVNVASDLYAAIDGLIDKLDRQVRRQKEKMKDHNRSDPKLAMG